MTFTEAQQHEIPFGKYKGSPLDEIAETDEGLQYLDWALGTCFMQPRTRAAIGIYLADPSIKKELKNLDEA